MLLLHRRGCDNHTVSVGEADRNFSARMHKIIISKDPGCNTIRDQPKFVALLG